MPTEVFDDTQDIVIGLLEAELPSSTADSSYPYPRLIPVGREEVRTFRTLILENDFLRLTVLPDLGGRLYSIFDKRTSTEILPSTSKLSAVPGGRRGATLPWGVELYTQGVERLNALGPTSSAAEPAYEEDSPGGIWLGESVEGTGLSFHLHYSLSPNRPEFSISAKIFNRTYTDLPYNGALAFHVLGGVASFDAGAVTYFSEIRSCGLWIDLGESVFDGRSLGDDLVLARFTESRTLAPRQLDSFGVRVVPFSGLPTLGAANAHGAATIDPEAVRVQVSEIRLGHKLVVLTQDGQTLEAPVDLYPEKVLEIPAEDLPSPAMELVLLSPTKEELLRVTAHRPPLLESVLAPTSHPRTETPFEEVSEENLYRMTFDVSRRHLAYLLLARKALTEKEYLKAENFFEHALLYNADDHLAWWAKAMAGRLREGPGDERPELLNAHFMAPFDPVLRAEAFLAQDQEMGKDPSPLLKSLEDTPEAFVEVAALLTELGLNDQATRWIDESLRHVDLVMLRYLQAFCFLRASRMHVEAAECMAAANRLGFTPPLPWRDVEWLAIAALHARFPEDEVLNRYLMLRSSGA